MVQTTLTLMKTILLFTLTAHIALAGTNNNITPTPTGRTASIASPVIDPISLKVKAAEACVEKIQLLIDILTSIHASLTNQAPRSECVLPRLAKAKAVFELVKNTPAQISNLSGDDAEEVAEEHMNRAALALTRIEVLLQEANDCLSLPLPATKQPRSKPITPDPELLPPPRPTTPIELLAIPATKMARPYVVRLPADCLKQGELAVLLSQALGNGVPDSAQTAIANLTRLEINPPNGWQADRAVSLDDFVVILAQILRINVEPNSEPRLQYQMMREMGLPLEQHFPSYSGKGEAPLLVELEVRRFLAIGLAEGITQPGFPD
jgi:hypothetical protein